MTNESECAGADVFEADVTSVVQGRWGHGLTHPGGAVLEPANGPSGRQIVVNLTQLAQAMEGAVTSTDTISNITSGSGNSSSPRSAKWRL